jgi:hypothetical protein
VALDENQVHAILYLLHRRRISGGASSAFAEAQYRDLAVFDGHLGGGTGIAV